MLLSLLSFLVGLALLLLVFLVLGNRQKGKMLNIYLLIVLAACGIQHVLIAAEEFNVLNSFETRLNANGASFG